MSGLDLDRLEELYELLSPGKQLTGPQEMQARFNAATELHTQIPALLAAARQAERYERVLASVDPDKIERLVNAEMGGEATVGEIVEVVLAEIGAALAEDAGDD